MFSLIRTAYVKRWKFVFCKYTLKLLNMPRRRSSEPEAEFTSTEKLLSKSTEGFIKS